MKVARLSSFALAVFTASCAITPYPKVVEPEESLTVCNDPGGPDREALVLPRSEAEVLIRRSGARFGLCEMRKVSAGEGAVIEGEGGVQLIIEPGALPFDAEIGVIALSPEDFVADAGRMRSVGGIEIVLRPEGLHNDLAPLKKPLEVSIPTRYSDISPNDVILVVQEMLTDSLGDPKRQIPPSLKQQFVATDLAFVGKDRIRTQRNETFKGVMSGGRFNFLVLKTGFATGVVSDARGIRPGVTVSNDTNTIVSVTDGAGAYTLPISGSCPCGFAVTGFDPLRGSSGSTGGTVPSDGATATADIRLTALMFPAITRDGVRNAGFERGDLTSWAIAGNATARQSLATSVATILPTEGQWMADINTSQLAAGEVGTSLAQTFRVPAGVTLLSFDFKFVSEEFPEWVGSQYNDAFTAVITTPNGDQTIAETSVNVAQNVNLIGDCGFPAGDNTCGQTGWLQGNVNLSAFSGIAAPVTMNIVFSALDAGDNIYDTHVLVDNIRFATVFVDFKILQGPTIAANANAARVQNEVVGANEILSQAGINVRVRNTRTVATTDALVDTDSPGRRWGRAQA